MAKQPAGVKSRKVPVSRFPRKVSSGSGKKAPAPTGKKDRRIPPSTMQLTNNVF